MIGEGGAAAACMAMESMSVLKAEAAALRANCNANDRGSCNESASGWIRKDASSAREAVDHEKNVKESRWVDEERLRYGCGQLFPNVAARMATSTAEDILLSSQISVRGAAKVDTTIENEDVDVSESALAKLKRKIRLKLLAEEARSSQQLAAADIAPQEEVKHFNNNIGRKHKSCITGAEQLAGFLEDGPTARIIRNSSTAYRSPALLQHLQHQQQQELSHLRESPRRNGSLLPQVRLQGRTIVDLSSDDDGGRETDVPDLDQTRFQNLQQDTNQRQRSHLSPRPEYGPRSAYDEAVETFLGPIFSRAVATVDQTGAGKMERSNINNDATRSKPVSAKNCQMNPSLFAAGQLGVGNLGQNQMSAVAVAADAAAYLQGPTSDDVGEKKKKPRGRPKGSVNLGPPKSVKKRVTKLAKQKEVLRSLQNYGAAAAIHYEQERENNILRNKAFLQGLSLCNMQETRRLIKTSVADLAAPASHTVQEYYDSGLEPELEDHVDEDIPVACNKGHLALEHLVESQRSQITSALSGSSCAIELMDKRPRLELTPRDQVEQELEADGDKNLETTKKPRRRGKGKATPKAKEKGPRGRPRKTNPPAVAATAAKEVSFTNQELLRIVAELLASAKPGTLPPSLLTQRLSEASSGGEPALGGHVSTKPPKTKAAARKKSAATVHPDKSKVESVSPLLPKKCGSPSPRVETAAAAKKRKDSWINSIPFETPKTEYEIQRDEVLRLRKDEFEKLGIVKEVVEEPLPPRQVRAYCKRWTGAPNPAFNRQTRLRERLKSGALSITEVKKEAVLGEEEDAEEDPEPVELTPDPSFEYSLIAKFSKWAPLQDHRLAAASGLEWHLDKLPSTQTGRPLFGSFQCQEGQQQLLDPLLTRIYTMDVGSIRGQSSGVLAAGGTQGRISVFALPASDARSRRAVGRATYFDGEEGSVDTNVALMSWAVDTSWISQVMFLPGQFQENELLLLSSSNDGRVVLWDINQVRTTEGTRGRELTQEGFPRVVCQTTTLHSGGIFGMHELDGRMATASEDSVGISIIRETMIFMERFVAGHHSGVIRNVRFRDRNILADCGTDMVIGILDLRCQEPCTLKIHTAHKTGMSLVEWSPGSENVLLSASLDPQLYLHDIRSPGLFSQVLEGHVHPRRVKCYSVYRPVFVGGGDAVVTPGEGTHQLSIYSTATGSTIGTAHVGYDTTILHWNPQVPNTEGSLWAACNTITQFAPVWRLPNDGIDSHHLQRPSSQYSNGGASVGAPPPPYLEELL